MIVFLPDWIFAASDKQINGDDEDIPIPVWHWPGSCTTGAAVQCQATLYAAGAHST